MFFFVFFRLMVIVAPEVTGLIAAVITSHPEACRPFSDVHSPPSMSTGPSISQSIVAVGQIGLEAHHYHPALSLPILPAGELHRRPPLRRSCARVAPRWFAFWPESELKIGVQIMFACCRQLCRPLVFPPVRGLN